MLHNSRRAVIRRVATYAFMTIFVITTTVVLMYILLGYRYDSSKNTFTQGGLVQFVSQPSGASVRVGTAELANRTRSKITLYPGTYDVTMSLNGYQDWKKNVQVKAGTVLWLSSARLVPQNPEVTDVYTMEQLGSMATHEQGKRIALIEDSRRPIVTLISTNDSNIAARKVTVPSSVYASAKSHRFTAVTQAENERHLLVRHNYDGKIEWLMIDMDNPNGSYMIEESDGNAIRDVAFDTSNDTRAYVHLKDGTLHRMSVNTGEQTVLPTPKLANFTLTSNGSIYYVTLPSKGRVSTGYLTYGTTTPRTIETIKTSLPVFIAANRYYDTSYIATVIGDQVTLRSYTEFPDSSSESTLPKGSVTRYKLPDSATRMYFKSEGRFIITEQARGLTTYDVELNKQSNATLDGRKTDRTEALQWLDRYHFWDDANGSARWYEFDGANQTALNEVVPGYDAVISPNDDYFYSIGRNDNDEFVLRRVKLEL